MKQQELEDEVHNLAAIVNKLIGQISDIDKDCNVYIQTDIHLIALQFEALDIRMRKNRE